MCLDNNCPSAKTLQTIFKGSEARFPSIISVVVSSVPLVAEIDLYLYPCLPTGAPFTYQVGWRVVEVHVISTVTLWATVMALHLVPVWSINQIINQSDTSLATQNQFHVPGQRYMLVSGRLVPKPHLLVLGLYNSRVEKSGPVLGHPIFATFPLLCIILNANRRTKMREAWEQCYHWGTQVWEQS